MGVASEKLYLNPYGVDLSMFYREENNKLDRTILFVGNWSFQKGADLLVEAIEEIDGNNYLVHVGSVGDAPLPKKTWFKSVGVVDQTELRAWYNKANVLVLPSRQDGFGLVLAQAVACGCPVIGTEYTGAQDLVDLMGPSDGIDVVPVADIKALSFAISNRLMGDSNDIYFIEGGTLLTEKLSWKAYGKRYSEKLQTLVVGGNL